MTTVFADASALVKHYLPEADSPLVDELMADADLVVSGLSTVETQSALWRQVRAGQVTEIEGRRLCRRFLHDMRAPEDGGGGVPRIGVTRDVLAQATALLARHPLRTGDAIQLASALAARDVVPDIVFLSFDHRLRAAAELEGLTVIPRV